MFLLPRPGALDIKRCFVRDCSGSLGKQQLTAVGVVVGTCLVSPAVFLVADLDSDMFRFGA